MKGGASIVTGVILYLFTGALLGIIISAGLYWLFLSDLIARQRRFEYEINLTTESGCLEKNSLLELSFLLHGLQGARDAALYRLIEERFLIIQEYTSREKRSEWRTITAAPDIEELLSDDEKNRSLHPIELIIAKGLIGKKTTYGKFQQELVDDWPARLSKELSAFRESMVRHYTEMGFLLSDRYKEYVRTMSLPATGRGTTLLFSASALLSTAALGILLVEGLSPFTKDGISLRLMALLVSSAIASFASAFHFSSLLRSYYDTFPSSWLTLKGKEALKAFMKTHPSLRMLFERSIPAVREKLSAGPGEQAHGE
ncbi:MAG: hypothetical protein RDV48_00640 [Candidatus Eremiobacteraeota bacterium]|nr:hypothetical protein [Candidatus Eremiobacteraeota bacterium]